MGMRESFGTLHFVPKLGQWDVLLVLESLKASSYDPMLKLEMGVSKV